MTHLDDAMGKLCNIIDLVKASGGLLIEAEVDIPAQRPWSDRSPIYVNITGKDATLFVRNNLELLKAFHQVVAATLDLHGDEHELVWVDVNHLRASHQARMQSLADSAVTHVHATLQPYAFIPMPSCERHMLHRALASSGMRFASRGEGPDRCVVLYPDTPGPSEHVHLATPPPLCETSTVLEYVPS